MVITKKMAHHHLCNGSSLLSFHVYAKLAVQWQQFTQFPCLCLVSYAVAAVYSVSMFMQSYLCC